MTIDQWLAIDEKFRPRLMRKWISRAKDHFQDVPIRVYNKAKDTDTLYCSTCGSMPDKVFGTDNPNDPMECLACFKNSHSADEFLV